MKQKQNGIRFLTSLFFIVFFSLAAFPAIADEETPPVSIFDAIKNNDLEQVQKLTQTRGFSYKQRNEDGETPFAYALLYYKNAAILKIFLDEVDDVNATVGNAKWPPLMLLLRRYADADLIEIALKKKANPNAKDANGTGALIYAYRYFHLVPVLKMLIDAGADVTQTDERNYNVLHLAINEGKYGIAELMLESGVSPDLPLPDKRWPIQLALQKERDEIISLLIEYGADLYPNLPEDKTLLMQTLTFAKNPETIDALIHAGLNVQDRDEQGKTPLMYAAEYTAEPEIIDILLANGAYPKTTDDEGNDAFAYLKKNKEIKDSGTLREISAALNNPNFSPDFFEVLKYGTVAEVERAIERGADINENDYNGLPPVILASQHAKNAGILRVLLKNGANPNVTDENGRRPLIYAADAGNIDTFVMLLEAKTDVNAVDINGDTVLMYLAQRATDTKMMSILLNNGADINKRNNIGKTALMTAAEFTASPDVLTFLMDKGATVMTKDESSRAAADYAKENIRLRRSNRYHDLMKRLSVP